ncbi:MAG: winged helix-turn-helix domain-containing protein [Candidatus Bathyarchaeia archaeon]
MLRRSKLGVFYDILMIAKDGAKKTEIVYEGNLTFTRANQYLQILEDQNLIERNGDRWVTTKKGLNFIKNFQRIKKHVPTNQDDE